MVDEIEVKNDIIEPVKESLTEQVGAAPATEVLIEQVSEVSREQVGDINIAEAQEQEVLSEVAAEEEPADENVDDYEEVVQNEIMGTFSDLAKELKEFQARLDTLTVEQIKQKDDEVEKYITPEKISALTKDMQIYGDERDEDFVDFVTMKAKMEAFEKIKNGAPERIFDNIAKETAEIEGFALASIVKSGCYSKRILYEVEDIDQDTDSATIKQKEDDVKKILDEMETDDSPFYTLKDCVENGYNIESFEEEIFNYIGYNMWLIEQKTLLIGEKLDG